VPADLSPDERALFVGIVADFKANHFKSSDTAMLVAYVRNVLTEQEASRCLAEDGFIRDCKASPWLNIRNQATKTMVMLARALRLSPLSRQNLPSRPNPTQPARPLSVYETMALESDNADEQPRASR
jgi:phage terminase small subunit